MRQSGPRVIAWPSIGRCRQARLEYALPLLIMATNRGGPGQDADVSDGEHCGHEERSAAQRRASAEGWVCGYGCGQRAAEKGSLHGIWRLGLGRGAGCSALMDGWAYGRMDVWPSEARWRGLRGAAVVLFLLIAMESEVAVGFRPWRARTAPGRAGGAASSDQQRLLATISRPWRCARPWQCAARQRPHRPP